MARTIAIALSGGIDSLVAAALLKEQGHRPIAIHFLTGYEALPSERDPSQKGSPGPEKQNPGHWLAPLARQLQIPLHIVDLRTDFQHHVVDYFVNTYRSGRTPNPCLVCNPRIKMGVLLEKALNLGADSLATGHYARILSAPRGVRRLLRGLDPGKDQSYFLARLTQDQLTRIVLPLGELTKTQTRQIAAAKGLRAAMPRESQDVCFIPDSDYGRFLANQPGVDLEPGPIETVTGEVIGSHRGIHLFTIGQRRGINCPAAAPYYVVRIDPARNCIVVGGKNDLLSSECDVAEVNWIVAPPHEPLRVMVKVRYRHAAVAATLFPIEKTAARIVFDSPQAAVTPGQGAVFFSGEEVLGGGFLQ